MKKKNTVKSKNIITITTIAILIVFIGVTYATLEYQRNGSKTNTITTGTLKLALQDTAEGVEIDPAIPLTDKQGEEEAQEYQFVLNNTGTGDASYRIKLVDDEDEYVRDNCTENRLNHNFITASITKTTDEEEAAEEKKTTILGEKDDVLDEGIIKAGAQTNYKLKIWLNDSADDSAEGAHFHGKIKLEAIVAGRTNYETGE